MYRIFNKLIKNQITRSFVNRTKQFRFSDNKDVKDIKPVEKFKKFKDLFKLPTLNSIGTKETTKSNTKILKSSVEKTNSTSTSTKILKPLLKKDFQDDANYLDDNNLKTTAPNLPPGEPMHKWESFFKRSSSRPLLDIDRSVKNQPNKVYLEFFEDIKGAMDSKQFLFAAKNILLNHPNITNEIKPEFYFFVLIFCSEWKRFDFQSKLNTINIIELFYLMPKKDEYFREIYKILEDSIDFFRVHVNNFTIEENLLLLGLLIHNNLYDSYLVNNFLERFSNSDIKEILNNKKVYKIVYFKNEIPIAKYVLATIDKHIQYVKSSGGKFSENFEEFLEIILCDVN